MEITRKADEPDNHRMETFIGVLWTAVVFAAIIAFLDPRLKAISKRLADEENPNGKEMKI